MTARTTPLTDRLYEYLLDVSVREPELLRRLRTETSALPRAAMQIGPEQGQFMALLIRLLNARRTIEIGVFTGYSSIVTALALPPDGELIACDVSEEWTAVARRYWREAGLEDRIRLHLAPAEQTLRALLAQGRRKEFDFAFVDADKTGYPLYHELCLELLRPGGLIVYDNTLWGGAVADPEDNDEDTEALRRFSRALKADRRIELSMLPVGDGLTLALKR